MPFANTVCLHVTVFSIMQGRHAAFIPEKNSHARTRRCTAI